MIYDRFFDWFQLAALASLACLAGVRSAMLFARGVRLLAVDRQRSMAQIAVDLAAVVILILWFYEMLACTLPLPHLLSHAWFSLQIAGGIVVRSVGVLTTACALVIYGLAVWALGDSWRMGIDRDSPGELVTGKIFSWSRNPIYVGLELYFTGTFLLLGRLVFLWLTLIFVVVIHQVIRREEVFLRQQFGDAYNEYCRRVGRYVTWRPIK